jgi:hypothetical protein
LSVADPFECWRWYWDCHVGIDVVISFDVLSKLHRHLLSIVLKFWCPRTLWYIYQLCSIVREVWTNLVFVLSQAMLLQSLNSFCYFHYLLCCAPNFFFYILCIL